VTDAVTEIFLTVSISFFCTISLETADINMSRSELFLSVENSRFVCIYHRMLCHTT